jgi:uncharacterized membrane protein YkvA (DUF1232 family)
MLNATRKAVPRIIPLMRHPHVPGWLKWLTIGGAVFIISPLDLLGDIPVIGVFDDVALLALLANLFVGFADHSVAKKESVGGNAAVMKTARPADPRAARPTAIKS